MCMQLKVVGVDNLGGKPTHVDTHAYTQIYTFVCMHGMHACGILLPQAISCLLYFVFNICYQLQLPATVSATTTCIIRAYTFVNAHLNHWLSCVTLWLTCWERFVRTDTHTCKHSHTFARWLFFILFCSKFILPAFFCIFELRYTPIHIHTYIQM